MLNGSYKYNMQEVKKFHENKFLEKFELLAKENKNIKGRGLFKNRITLNRLEVQMLLNISNPTITRLIDKKVLIPEKGRSINSPHHFSFKDVLNYFIELQVYDVVKNTL